MIVKIFTFKNGMEEIEEVTAIRIKSKDYNLLILKDYLSVVGEIEGFFEIETKEDKFTYNDIKAYYLFNNNNFDVLIEGV
ncbi:MAG: hypothetical protein IKQ29_01140 [Bacilli bacterium]|nr:hypothetical protein [Bacilli bacterium]